MKERFIFFLKVYWPWLLWAGAIYANGVHNTHFDLNQIFAGVSLWVVKHGVDSKYNSPQDKPPG